MEWFIYLINKNLMFLNWEGYTNKIIANQL